MRWLRLGGFLHGFAKTYGLHVRKSWGGPSFYARQPTMLRAMPLVSAAATQDDNNSQDDNPGAVIVEQMAKTGVVHVLSSVSYGETPLDTIICNR